MKGKLLLVVAGVRRLTFFQNKSEPSRKPFSHPCINNLSKSANFLKIKPNQTKSTGGEGNIPLSTLGWREKIE